MCIIIIFNGKLDGYCTSIQPTDWSQRKTQCPWAADCQESRDNKTKVVGLLRFSFQSYKALPRQVFVGCSHQPIPPSQLQTALWRIFNFIQTELYDNRPLHGWFSTFRALQNIQWLFCECHSESSPVRQGGRILLWIDRRGKGILKHSEADSRNCKINRWQVE